MKARDVSTTIQLLMQTPTCTVAEHLKHGTSVRNLNQRTEIEDSSPQYMIPLSEPTHHQTLINVDNVALSSLIVHFHCCSGIIRTVYEK